MRDVNYWDLRWNMYLVQFFVELIELRGLCHYIFVHHEGGLNLLVSSFSEEVESIRYESLVEIDTIVS